MKMSTLGWAAWILVVIGALNWGLIGAFNYSLVSAIFGVGVIAKWLYILVGLGGLYFLWMAFTKKKK